MDKVSYLKHCTSTVNLNKILKNGYILSGLKSGHEEDYGNYSKIFLQIEFYKYQHKSISYNKHCILLDKKILLNRNDYAINKSYIGRINKNSLKKPKYFNDMFFKKIHRKHNEVIFSNKISLKKYMKGIILGIFLDSTDDIRLDLILENNFKIYSKIMVENCKIYKKGELKKRYNKGKKILNNIKKYTNDIRFRYIPYVHLDS